jgi:hypothetical protein
VLINGKQATCSYLEEVLGEVDGDEAGATAHATQVVSGHVHTHLVMVDHHRRERRRRVEEATVDDDDADVARTDAGRRRRT